MTRIKLFLLILITISTQLSAQSIYPFQENGKWGYKDYKDKIIAKPAYDEAYGSVEGFAMVTQNKKYGFINAKGKLVIPCIYDDARHFSNKMAAVKTNGKWGFISTNGKIKIKCTFDRVNNFNYDNTYAVVEWDGKNGMIDMNGKVILPNHYEDITGYGDELFCVQKDGLFGYINVKEESILPFKYYMAYPFKDGYAEVGTSDTTWGFIDKTGKEIIPCQFAEVYYLPKYKVFQVFNKYELCGFYREDGTKIFDLIFTGIAEEIEQLLIISIYEKNGLYDANLNELLPPDYDNLYWFDRYIDKKTKGHLFFSVQKNDTLFGIYDATDKKMVLEPTYSSISQDESTMDVLVTKDKKMGVFSFTKQALIIEPTYDWVEGNGSGFFNLNKGGYMGLADENGKVILEPKYSYIDVKYKQKNIMAITEDEQTFYFNLKGEPITVK